MLRLVVIGIIFHEISATMVGMFDKPWFLISQILAWILFFAAFHEEDKLVERIKKLESEEEII